MMPHIHYNNCGNVTSFLKLIFIRPNRQNYWTDLYQISWLRSHFGGDDQFDIHFVIAKGTLL